MKSSNQQPQSATAHHSPPPTAYLRLPQVLEIFPVSRSSWWAGVKTGKYPKAVKLGRRTTAWSAESIRALIEHVANDAGDAA